MEGISGGGGGRGSDEDDEGQQWMDELENNHEQSLSLDAPTRSWASRLLRCALASAFGRVSA